MPTFQIYFGNNILAESGGECESESDRAADDDDPYYWNKGDVLMAVHLEFDESGDSNIILVSMQIATVQKAKKLKRAWNSELRKVKVPLFHAVDFKKAMGEGIFGHLTRQERTDHLNKLAGFVRSTVGIGLSAWVDIKEYNERTTNDYRSEFGTAYAHAIHTLVLGAHLYCKTFHLGFDVHILIEGGHKNSDQVAAILRDLQKGNGHPDALLNIITVATGCKKDSPLLQAADMLAYGEWQNMSHGRLDIYNALHVDGSRYKPELINVNEEMVETFVSGAFKSKADVALKKKLWWEQTYGKNKQRGISTVRSDNEKIDSDSAREDKSGTGSRESSQKAET